MIHYKKLAFHLFSSGLYRRHRIFTCSALNISVVAGYTAGGESHPASKTSNIYYYCKAYLSIVFMGIFAER